MVNFYVDHMLSCKQGFSLTESPCTWKPKAQIRLMALHLHQAARQAIVKPRTTNKIRSHCGLDKNIDCTGGTDFSKMLIKHPLTMERVYSSTNNPAAYLDYDNTKTQQNHPGLIQNRSSGAKPISFPIITLGKWHINAHSNMISITHEFAPRFAVPRSVAKATLFKRHAVHLIR